MDDLEKLELLQHALQEIANGCDAKHWLRRSFQLVEELREPHLPTELPSLYTAEEQGDRQQKNEQDFELGADYGRVNGWYSDTFGDSFSDSYDY